jgi:hypothetical protein
MTAGSSGEERSTPAQAAAADQLSVVPLSAMGSAVRSLFEGTQRFLTPAALTRAWEADPDSLAIISGQYALVQRCLRQRDVELFEAMMGPPLVAACSMLSDPHPTDSARANAATVLQQAARNLSQFAQDRSDLTARRTLAIGLLSSCLLAVLAIGGVGAIFVSIDYQGIMVLGSSGEIALRDTVVCLSAGAAGAATSVLLRLRQVERLSPDTTSFGTAVFRVAVGVLFALALLLLVKSQIVNVLKDPATSPEQYDEISAGFFWGAAGLLAGFNERWVGGMLERDSKDSTTGHGIGP